MSLLKQFYDENISIEGGKEITPTSDEYKGIYVGVKLDDKSVDKLISFAKNIGIRNILPRNKFHITVIYSRKFAELPVNEKISIEATPKKLILLGENNEVVALALDCIYLNNRHKELMNKYDLTYHYESYIPHITLSYNHSGGFKLHDIKKVGKLRLVSEYTEDLNLNYKEERG